MSKKTITITTVIILILLITILYHTHYRYTIFVTEKPQKAINYQISIDNISISKKITPNIFLASNKECLKQLEDRYNINLSKKFTYLKEYKDDTFVYFVQFHTARILV